MEKELVEKAVEFHGHACFGLMLGLKAAGVALRELGVSSRARDEELIAIAETEGCGVDGLMVLTGCTLGKGNLYLKDYGKHVYTVGSRKDGRAVRVALKFLSPEERERLRGLPPREILDIPEQELLTVSALKLDLPPQARVFNSLPCAKCGEGVMESRARLQDGRVVCPDCFESYPSHFTA